MLASWCAGAAQQISGVALLKDVHFREVGVGGTVSFSGVASWGQGILSQADKACAFVEKEAKAVATALPMELGWRPNSAASLRTVASVDPRPETVEDVLNVCPQQASTFGERHPE